MFVIELVSLFADFTAISLLERTVLSGSDFAYSLYGVFPGLLGQCIFGDISETNGQEKPRSDHVTWNA